MATRRPLVNVNGAVSELPIGDTVAGSGGGGGVLSVVTRSSTTTTISISSGTLDILNHNGSTTTNVTVA